jgi:hypothetical protein
MELSETGRRPVSDEMLRTGLKKNPENRKILNHGITRNDTDEDAERIQDKNHTDFEYCILG